MKSLLVVLLSLTASETTVPKQRQPILLQLVSADALTAQVLIAGTKDRPVYFFKDPDGNRLRVERTGDWDCGFTRSYVFIGREGGYVEIQSFEVFHHQSLSMEPVIVHVNGATIAGYLDTGAETKKVGKKIFAEFKRLPSNFQRALYNFCVYTDGVEGVDLDGSKAGLLLSDNWLSPGLPDLKITVFPVPKDDENAIPNFQRLFTE